MIVRLTSEREGLQVTVEVEADPDVIEWQEAWDRATAAVYVALGPARDDPPTAVEPPPFDQTVLPTVPARPNLAGSEVDPDAPTW